MPINKQNTRGATVSFVVPMFNAEPTVADCLNSLRKQTYENIEIIIIDDGSTDGSAAICQKMARQDHRLRYFYQENRGVSSARNLGISKTSGEYISFIDSDDIVRNDFCEKMLTAFSGSSVDLAVCDFSTYTIENTDKQQSRNKCVTISSQKIVERLFYELGGFVWNKMYKRDIIVSRHIIFDEDIRMCEDLLFNFQYALAADRAYFIETPLYQYNNTKGATVHMHESWFSSLNAYKKILHICRNASSGTRNIATLKAFFSLREAETRCKIMNLKLADAGKHYGELSKKINANPPKAGTILFSANISNRDKTKFILWHFFRPLASKIEEHRLSAHCVRGKKNV